MEERTKLNKEQINELIMKSRSGDNAAWETLVEHYTEYIHSRAWKRIAAYNIKNAELVEEELFAAGWVGFVSALKNHDAKKGSFTTYVTICIDGEMTKHLRFEFNSMGLTHMPPKTENSQESKVERVYAPTGNNEDDNSAQMAVFEAMLSRAYAKNFESGITIPPHKDLGDYMAERRAIQVLDVLKLMTE